MLTIQDISFALPASYGKIVGLCQYRDRVIVACEHGLYELVDDGFQDYSMRERLVSELNEAKKKLETRG